MLVLHYTGMPTCAEAVARLTDAEAKVSSHYPVADDGQIMRLVAEDKRAWHAGKSWWRGVTDINSASIGIEICNPGHEFRVSSVSRSTDRCADPADRRDRSTLRDHARQHRRAFGHCAVAQAGSGRAVSLGRASPNCGSLCRARSRICSTRRGAMRDFSSRSSGSAMTSAIPWRRPWRSSAAFAPNCSTERSTANAAPSCSRCSCPSRRARSRAAAPEGRAIAAVQAGEESPGSTEQRCRLMAG